MDAKVASVELNDGQSCQQDGRNEESERMGVTKTFLVQVVMNGYYPRCRQKREREILDLGFAPSTIVSDKVGLFTVSQAS